MHAVVLGCGRVGSGAAIRLRDAGHTVAVIDQVAAAFDRLGDRTLFEALEGHALDLALLRSAGIERAGACVVATNGDNTNLVIGQFVAKRWPVPFVIVRVLDPARAEVFAGFGVHTVSPTAGVIDLLVGGVLSGEAR